MNSYDLNPEPEKWPETYWKRPIPEAHWRGVGLIAALLVAAFMIFWETYWRLDGYEPSLENTDELWARTRDKADSGAADAVVTIGASRIWYGLDLDVWQQDFGGPRPIVLANGGTNPRPMLADLADNSEFKGLLLVGFTPGSFFRGSAPRAKNLIKYRKNRSISGRSDYLLSIPIQSAFSSLNRDLRLGILLRERWFKIPSREGINDRDGVRYFGAIQSDRRVKMWHKCEQDRELQRIVGERWVSGGQNFKPPTEEEVAELIGSAKADVDKIRARGGDVVFVRFPSTQGVREREREQHPKEQYFDRLIEETDTVGIHFEDYASLSGFWCPEWSHLSRVDAVTFTRNLIPIMKGLMEEKDSLEESGS